MGGRLPARDRGHLKAGGIGLLLACMVSGVVSGCLQSPHRSTAAPSSTAGHSSATASRGSDDAAKPEQIRLLAAGDFNYNDTVNISAMNGDGTYDYVKLQPAFPDVFKAADIRFCNQITPIAGEKYGIRGYPKFNAPLAAADDMQRLGCNVINMASNHSFDVSQDGIDANVDEWARLPGILAAAGQNRSPQELRQVHYFTVKGVKFAFLAYTTYVNTGSPPQDDYGVTQFDRALAHQQITEAKHNGAQFVIVSTRWGTEYSPDITPEQRADAQFLADEGASLILGHGRHVVQPVDTLTGASGNRTTVWYGLGNYINSQLPPETLFGGLAVIGIDRSTAQVTANQFLPLYVHYEWTAQQSQAEDLLARNNFSMYLLEDVTQPMIDAQQLHTTAAEQEQRMQSVLSRQGADVRLISSKEYFAQ